MGSAVAKNRVGTVQMSQMPLGLKTPDFEDEFDSIEAGEAIDCSTGFWGINGGAKRALDIVISVSALIFLSPLMLLASLLVKLDGGSVFYVQDRIGRGGNHFRMFKFRTMRVDGDAVLKRHLDTCAASRLEWVQFQKLRNDPRVTSFGRYLRASSIDELPQLLNVLFGDMSIVGQRPILPHQREAYGQHIAGYELARPGITGLWQVMGRNRLSFDRRAELGSEYVDRWSLRFDLWILVITIPALLSSSGAY
jgi:exopolysaccharide production protein ExoY